MAIGLKEVLRISWLSTYPFMGPSFLARLSIVARGLGAQICRFRIRKVKSDGCKLWSKDHRL